MVINKEAHEVELTYAGQEVAVTETATSFVNERQKVTVSLEKAIEKNDIFNIGNGDEVKNNCKGQRNITIRRCRRGGKKI